jgi:hypothetical protein
MTYVVLAVLRPGVDGKVKITLGVHISGESNVPGLRGLPALAGCHVRDSLPRYGVLARGLIRVGCAAATAIGPCTPGQWKSLNKYNHHYIQNW